MLHYHSTREAGLLLNLLHENWGGCFGKEKYYRTIGETAGRVEHWGGCVGTEDSGGCADTDRYYWSTREAVLGWKNAIVAVRRLCWYSRVLKEPSGCCARTAEYYRCTREAVVVQQNTTGTHKRLCWYRRVLQEL